jgi:hypothetical protein
VKKVLDVLKGTGVLEVVGHQRRGGKPSENYPFRKTDSVVKILDAKDQALGKANVLHMRIQADECTPDEHSLSPSEHSSSPSEHDKSYTNQSVPSSASSALSLTADTEASEYSEKEIDSSSLFGDMPEEILSVW